MNRFVIYAGNYGSGKTELSLNTALKYALEGKTALVDMDVVNPYFRSSESRQMLEEHGIRLIKPPFANTTVDVPSLSGEIYAAFNYEYAVFDAGGDPVGAAALGVLKQRFDAHRSDLSLFYVINARRPLQENINDIIAMLRQIEDRSRLTVDGLVNNTNLANETTVEDLIQGAKVCADVSRITKIPIAFTSGTRDILNAYKNTGYTGKLFPIDIYTRPDWF